MLAIVGWLILSVLVGVVAEARGRSGTGFFFLSLFLSPLIGVIFALAMPNLKHQAMLERLAQRTAMPPPLPAASLLGRADRVTIDRSPRPFEPDGVFTGIPYRVAADGSIEAIMQGAMVRFADYDRFISANGGEH